MKAGQTIRTEPRFCVRGYHRCGEIDSIVIAGEPGPYVTALHDALYLGRKFPHYRILLIVEDQQTRREFEELAKKPGALYLPGYLDQANATVVVKAFPGKPTEYQEKPFGDLELPPAEEGGAL